MNDVRYAYRLRISVAEPGPAAGRREDRRERRQRRHRAQDHDHHDRRPDQRQRDVEEALPGAGAVEARRFVDVGRQRRERRQQHQERERRPLPGVDRDHRDQRQLRIAEPVVAAAGRARASPCRRGRRRARAPACARTGRRRPARARSAGSRRRAAAPWPFGICSTSSASDEADDHLQHDRRRGVDAGQRERIPEARIAAHLGVVVDAGEARQPRHAEVDAVQAVPAEVDERRRRREHQHGERGQRAARARSGAPAARA